jgi:transcriptional regulator with XRE-family HTH domain
MAKKLKNERPKIVSILAKRIKQIIIKKRLIQKNVAYDVDIDVENLRKYIKGEQEMKIGMLFRISKSLDMTMSELLKDMEEDIDK